MNLFQQNKTLPCLVKIYFLATAGNCGLIMHGLHTAHALCEFALRTQLGLGMTRT